MSGKMLWAACVGGLAVAVSPAEGHERRRVAALDSGSDFCFIAIHPLECGSAPARGGAAPLSALPNFGLPESGTDEAPAILAMPVATASRETVATAPGGMPQPRPAPANPWLLIAGVLPMLAWRHRPRH